MDSSNFIGSWKIIRHTTAVSNGKEVDNYKTTFSMKFNTNGTCYRIQSTGTDTLEWAVLLKTNSLLIFNGTQGLSGFKLNILKNEPDAHQWEERFSTIYLVDTAWVPAIVTDVWNVTRQ